MSKSVRIRETAEEKKVRAKEIIRILRKTYPGAKCALDFKTPYQLLVATILSAQCTDKRVNMVTPELFKQYPDAGAMAAAKLSDIEKLIQSTGFYKNKAKNILAASQIIAADYGGKMPDKQEVLVELPGVGRKTANVVLGYAYGIPGLTVDTHMIRLNRLLGLTRNTDAVKIEFDLMPLVPQKDWTDYSSLIIHHGRARCVARRPDCGACEIQHLCPSAFAAMKPRKKS